MRSQRDIYIEKEKERVEMNAANVRISCRSRCIGQIRALYDLDIFDLDPRGNERKGNNKKRIIHSYRRLFYVGAFDSSSELTTKSVVVRGLRLSGSPSKLAVSLRAAASTPPWALMPLMLMLTLLEPVLPSSSAPGFQFARVSDSRDGLRSFLIPNVGDPGTST